MDATANLFAILMRLPEPVFAAVDGAAFPHAPSTFATADIPARALFVGQHDRTIEVAGPYLAVLNARRLKTILAIPQMIAATIFWGSSAGEAAMFRHLRSLNLVDIQRESEDASSMRSETVLFRHWDPDVMAIVLPILTPPQLARLFGPATAMVLRADLIGGVKHVKRYIDWPVPEHGRLSFASAQMRAIAAGMQQRSDYAIVNFLRGAAPQITARMDDKTLMTFVASSNETGRSLGIATERGLGRWAYLMFVSKGTFAKSPSVRSYIVDTAGNPDEQVGKLMLGMANELRRRCSAALGSRE